MRKFPVLTKPPYRTVTTPRHLLLIAGEIVETCLRLSFGFAETTYARLLAVFNFQLSTFNFQSCPTASLRMVRVRISSQIA